MLWGDARTSRPRRRAACWTAVPTGWSAGELAARRRIDEIEAVEEAAPAQRAARSGSARRSRGAEPSSSAPRSRTLSSTPCSSK